jgi:prepilin-type processing-associated H-X9-DG protein
MNCPSNPPEALGTANSSYCVNVGQVDRNTPAAANPTRDYAANGVFHYRGIKYTSGGFTETLVSMNSSYVSAQDGMGTTILMSENADAYTWPGEAVGSTYAERYLGFGYHHTDGIPGTPGPLPDDPMGLNIQYAQSKTGTGVPPLTNNGYMRPSAYHPSNVQVAFCDGRVRPLSEDISYGVFQALMTPRGSHAYQNNGTIAAFPGTNANPVTPPTAPHAATRTIDEAAIQ